MIIIPPVELDHIPIVPVIELRLPAQSVIAVCATRGAKVAAMGCQWWQDGKCIILLPETLAEPDMSALRRHEHAHCNGWSGDHKGAR